MKSKKDKPPIKTPKVTLAIDLNVYRDLRKICALKEVKITNAVTDVLRKFVDKQAKKMNVNLEITG